MFLGREKRLKLHAKEAAFYAAHGAELRHNGELVAKLSGAEALNLCDREYVEGIAGAYKGEDGEKQTVLRYLSLIVSMAKLRKVLSRVAVKSIQAKAEDSRTFQRTRFGIEHHFGRCRLYAGGPTRLLDVRTT